MNSDFLELMGVLLVVSVFIAIGVSMESCSTKDARLGKVPYIIEGKVYKCQEQK